MQIAVVSDAGSAGGAGVAATRLCVALRKRGHRIGMIHLMGFTPHPDSADDFHPVSLGHGLIQRGVTTLRCEPLRRWAQAVWVKRFRSALSEIKPEIVLLNNLHGAYWDIEVVEECLRHAPVVWTLHDMWGLTGSCAYSYDCRQYETSCTRACPQLGQYPTLPARMVPAAHERRKRLYAARPNLIHVAPSRWLAELALEASHGSVPSLSINHGLDLEIFRPNPKSGARRELGLPDDDLPTLLAAAASLTDPRKGMRTLIEALALLPEHRIRLLLMGRNRIESHPASTEMVHLGSINGDHGLARAYAAADALVHPAHAENQPLVIVEALACGRPVAALPVGGVPEMVVDGVTGWVAGGVEPAALASALRRALEERPQWPRYEERARSLAVATLHAAFQAERYEDIFEQMIQSSKM